jgi:AcrR family transcriptional regulator
MRRATSDAQKQQRRAAILAIAQELFAHKPYDAITMSEIAERAGLAKGTIYLYFATKEELFLVIQEQQLAAWFAELNAGLEGLRGAHDTRLVAELFCETLLRRLELTRLLAMLHSTLEQNIDADTALRFKQFLRENIVRTGGLLEQCLPALGPGEGARLLLHAQALVIGLSHLADPAPVVREVLRMPGLELFEVDFAREFTSSFAALLAGRVA